LRKKKKMRNKKLSPRLMLSAIPIIAALFILSSFNPPSAAGMNDPLRGPILTGDVILDLTFLQALAELQELEQEVELEGEADEDEGTPDPFKPSNKFAFKINDKIYFWILKPTAQGYDFVMPRRGQIGVRNFFRNIGTPSRLINCTLQGKFKAAGGELARFGINSTIGVLGFGDPAEKWFHLELHDEDFGQTMAKWGVGHVCYFEWVFFGPSSLRETVGLTVDWALDPLNYVGFYAAPARIIQLINNTSLRIGDYEALMDAALDPYTAKRDAYLQNRQMKVEK
jgi:phospholipid-binding lipoprotein MlaA